MYTSFLGDVKSFLINVPGRGKSLNPMVIFQWNWEAFSDKNEYLYGVQQTNTNSNQLVH